MNPAFSSTARRSRGHGLFLVPAVLAASTFPVHAVDYSATGSVSAVVSHHDNLRMTERNQVSVEKYLVSPIISFAAKSETSMLSLNSIFYVNRYSDDRFDSDDQNIGLSMAHEMERWTLGLNANLVRESTITSEELSSGIVGETAERAERRAISGSASYTLTDTNLLQFQGAYLDQDYDASGFTGYENSSATLDWLHIFSERWKLVLSASYTKYESEKLPELPVPYTTIIVPVERDDGSVDLVPVPRGAYGDQSYSSITETKGGQIGIDYQWSEQSLLQARLGSSNSKSSRSTSFNNPGFCSSYDYNYISTQAPEFLIYLGGVCYDDDHSRVSTAQVSWSWNNEKQKFNLNGTKQTSPTANGYTVDSTQLRSSWSYRLTERDTLGANLTVVRNRALNEDETSRNAAIANRNYASINVSYRRQLSEKWSVSASYQYSEQEYTDLDNNAHGNVVSLTIGYKPQGWHWAR